MSDAAGCSGAVPVGPCPAVTGGDGGALAKLLYGRPSSSAQGASAQVSFHVPGARGDGQPEIRILLNFSLSTILTASRSVLVALYDMT